MNLIKALRVRGNKDIKVEYAIGKTYVIVHSISLDEILCDKLRYMNPETFLSNQWEIVKEKKKVVIEAVKWEEYGNNMQPLGHYDIFKKLDGKEVKMTLEWSE